MVTSGEDWHNANSYVQGRLTDGIVVNSSSASNQQQEASSPQQSSASQSGTGGEGTEYQNAQPQATCNELFKKLQEVCSCNKILLDHNSVITLHHLFNNNFKFVYILSSP